MGASLSLDARISPGAQVDALAHDGWRLSIPDGPAGLYRCAQLDDHLMRQRRRFCWQVPVSLSLKARVSSRNLPGTWGFGFWNDPFNFNLGAGGAMRRLPALPNTAWFFYAAPPNYLSLRDDLPAQGFLAATFRSLDWQPHRFAGHQPQIEAKKIPWPFRWAVDGLRWMGSWFVGQDASSLSVDPTAWHSYTIECLKDGTSFRLDGEIIFRTKITPRGRLGLVLWIDNQYAAFPPGGRLTFGTSPSPQPAWLELAELSLT
jgi:hypothetical protein